jgi:hypothetical protein
MELEEIEHKIACNELSAAQVFTQMKRHIDAENKKGWNSAIRAAADMVDFGAGVDGEILTEQLLSA